MSTEPVAYNNSPAACTLTQSVAKELSSLEVRIKAKRHLRFAKNLLAEAFGFFFFLLLAKKLGEQTQRFVTLHSGERAKL